MCVGYVHGRDPRRFVETGRYMYKALFGFEICDFGMWDSKFCQYIWVRFELISFLSFSFYFFLYFFSFLEGVLGEGGVVTVYSVEQFQIVSSFLVKSTWDCELKT